MGPLVEMKHISKFFPGVKALNQISFELMPGEVHILLGENGAGKSTLMKILSGAYKPNEGSIAVRGKQYSSFTPSESKKCGISIIYQELSVINELSIAENIFVGRIPGSRRLGLSFVNKGEMERRTAELLKRVDLNKSPSTQVSTLSISEKQLVEIAKSLAFNAEIIIMDEPTSSLTEEEVQSLFAIIRRLKAEGKGIVYISHKLREIMEIGDRVTVLKDGTYVGTRSIQDITTDDLITMMVGRELEEKYQSVAPPGEGGEVLFEAKGITRKDGRVSDVNFTLRKGEILGFSGLIGAGRSELMCAIFGADPMRRGELWLHGSKLEIRNPYDALKNGLALVTENRRETGFFPNFSIKRNISLAKQLVNTRMGGMSGLIDAKDEQRIAEEQQKAINIKCSSLTQNITQLSGGNQQKVILGKWMAAGVKLVIFDEPTKGIDVGAKAEIYRLMRGLADEGIGVMIVSSEMPELLSVCDRMLVMSAGRVTAEFRREDASEELLMKAAALQEGEVLEN